MPLTAWQGAQETRCSSSEGSSTPQHLATRRIRWQGCKARAARSLFISVSEIFNSCVSLGPDPVTLPARNPPAAPPDESSASEIALEKRSQPKTEKKSNTWCFWRRLAAPVRSYPPAAAGRAAGISLHFLRSSPALVFFGDESKQQRATCELQSPGARKKNALLNHARVSEGDGVIDVESMCAPGASEGIAFPLLPPKIH